MDDLLEMPTDWDRCLAIVPHPDDMEYGASAAVAAWTDADKSVAYLLVTRGEAGIDDLDPAEAATLRAQEQQAACAAVGVETLEFLDFPTARSSTGCHCAGPSPRRFAAIVRSWSSPSTIAIPIQEAGSTWPTTGSPGWQCSTPFATPPTGGSSPTSSDGLPPWSGVRWVAMSGSPQSSHAVDITASFERGVASLAAHRRYLAALGDGPMADPEAFLRAMAEQTAEQFGGRLATSFELIPM